MSYEQKYELIESDLPNLYRIKALKNFNDVRKGNIGGYVENENNLAQEGNCWIYDNAQVRDDARVYGNAQVYDNARVCNNAEIYDNAEVYGDAWVYEKAQIYGNAWVFEKAQVCTNARIYDNALVHGNTIVLGSARVYGEVEIFGNAWICNDAEVKTDEDYIVFKNWWSSGRYFTWTRSNDKWIVGCFFGSGQELIKKAYADSEKSGREYERIVRYVEEIKNSEL